MSTSTLQNKRHFLVKNKASTIEVYAIKKIKIKERNHKIDLSWLGDLYLHSLFKVTDACPPKSVFTPFT